MATARERLLQALEAILAQPHSNEGLQALKRLLNSYRVQTKPGETSHTGVTARDSLESTLTKSWQNKRSMTKDSINILITPYRMQLKQGLSRVKHKGPKTTSPSTANSHSEDFHKLSGKKARLRENYARYENAYFSDKKSINSNKSANQAIAGGPEKKSSTRGQCPKCRSNGVVLAQNYETEGYYSCIYCGYQSYPTEGETKLDLPQASEHLGNAYDEFEPE